MNIQHENIKRCELHQTKRDLAYRVNKSDQNYPSNRNVQ